MNIKKLEYKQLLSEKEIDTIRKDFPFLKKMIHMASCSQGALSEQARSAANSYLDSWENDGMDWDSWLVAVNNAKAQFAALIGAEADEIAIGCSVSDLVSSIATALDFSGERKKVVIGDGDFPTVNYNWLAQGKNGALIDFVPVKEDYSIDISEYESRIDEKTLITSFAHVYYLNGYKQDIKTIVDLAHSKGSLAMVDVYQSLGSCKINVKEPGADIVVCGAMKYLLGPAGIAFMYVKKDILSSFKPQATGWFGQKDPFLFQSRYIDWAADARKFDTGTPPVITSYIAAAGMEILNKTGAEAIEDRINMLSGYSLEKCLEYGLNVISPLDVSKKGSTTALKVPEGLNSHDVEVNMRKKGILVSARAEAVRIAPHFYSKISEIDEAVKRLSEVMGK